MGSVVWRGCRNLVRQRHRTLTHLAINRILNRDEYDPSRHRVGRPKVELLVDKTGVGVTVTGLLKARGL